MKKVIQSLTRGQILLWITGFLAFLVFLILAGISGFLSTRQTSQSMAERWSNDGGVAQISCFFSQNAEVSEETIQFFGHALTTALTEASITQDSPNAGARLWTDAYSAVGSVTITSNKGNVTVDAVGIGGDFFMFHPLYLVSGSYFSGNDLMKDHIIIDEDTAWQLFGSNDVAGQIVSISGIPHIIAGVVEKQEGRLEEAAGLDGSVAYVSFETLNKYGKAEFIGQYEIAMPNPVSSYALNYVREKIGIDEKEVEVIENTTRYDLVPLIKILAGFGTRSMNGKAILYPYWENIARGYEDILAALLFGQFLFLLYPVILLIIFLRVSWKHRTWTARSVYLEVKDKWERFLERRRAARKNRGKHLSDPSDAEVMAGRKIKVRKVKEKKVKQVKEKRVKEKKVREKRVREKEKI